MKIDFVHIAKVTQDYFNLKIIKCYSHVRIVKINGYIICIVYMIYSLKKKYVNILI